MREARAHNSGTPGAARGANGGRCDAAWPQKNNYPLLKVPNGRGLPLASGSAKSVFGNPSIGYKLQISCCTSLAFFVVAAGYACESRLVQHKISSLSLDHEFPNTL
jgi:hypothetical protein